MPVQSEESRKILLREMLVCISGAWGGLEQVAAADALDRGALGYKVKVLCLQGTPIHESLAHKKEITVLPLSFRPRDLLDFKLKNELERLIVEDDINLIHLHQPTLLGSVSPWLWRFPRVSLIVSRHIMSGHNKKDFFHRALYSRVDQFFVMSETLKENVLATHPIKEKNVKLVRLGLDFDRFDPAKVDARAQRQRWGADDDTHVIGLVGRIDPAKGHSTFIRAAAALLGNTGFSRKLKFVIVGEETLGQSQGYIDELKEMVTQFRIENHIVFAGYQHNIPEVMNALDVLVMPSRQEAFGLVAIEAMAMETMIVISSGGSAREIVGENEEFGLLVRPDDAYDLQKKLQTLISNPDLCKQMGKQARGYVMANYDKKKRIADTLENYDWALRKRSGLKRSR